MCLSHASLIRTNEIVVNTPIVNKCTEESVGGTRDHVQLGRGLECSQELIIRLTDDRANAQPIDAKVF